MRFPQMLSGAAAGGHGMGRALHAARAGGGGVVPAYTCLPNVPDEMELEIIKNMGPAELQSLRATSTGCRTQVDWYVQALENEPCLANINLPGPWPATIPALLAAWGRGDIVKWCDLD